MAEKIFLFAACLSNMSVYKIFLLLTFLLILYSKTACGQGSASSLKFFGLSLHPHGDPNAHLMPINPDGQGYLVLNLGGMLGHEIAVLDSAFSVKAIQSLYADCAGQAGGFSHIGIRFLVFKKNRHTLSGGIGPTLIFRRNWHRLPEYQPSGFFKGEPDDNWQYQMLWYGGELEYNYTVRKQTDLSFTFVPGYPNLISLSAGFRYTY